MTITKEEAKNVRRKGILGLELGPIRSAVWDVLEGRRVAGSNPAEAKEKEEAKSDELPPEFKPLERKYGRKMAKAAHDFIENYLDAMFE